MNQITRTNIPRKVSGIYQIQSKFNGKIYVGSALNLQTRKRIHLSDLKLRKHHSVYLQRHFNKYGKVDLQFSILEFCEKERLIEREQFYLDTFTPEFNICKIANSCLGVIHSPETREKMRAANIGRKHSEETKRKIREGNIGKKYSKETCQKISNVNKGRKHSEETKRKLSIARIGKLIGNKNPFLGNIIQKKLNEN